MKNLKIRVSNEAESREAQELLFRLNLEKSNWSNFSLPKFIAARIAKNNFSDYVLGDVGMYKYKEITLPELRAMVNPMKEYLEKQPDGTYSLVLRGDLCKESDILIPEGAEVATSIGDSIYFWKPSDNSTYVDGEGWVLTIKGMVNFDEYTRNPLCHILWQRDQDEPFLTPESILDERKIPEIYGTVRVNPDLNDQYAEIEQVRQHNHYFKDVSGLNEIDVYMVLKLFNVTDPCLQHIAKKALCAGQRGHKDFKKDLQDILDTAKRAVEINN